MTTTDILRQPVTGPGAWTRADIAADDSWVYELSDAEVADLERALDGVRGWTGKLTDLTRSDFPLPVLAQRLARLEDDVRAGRGFALLRGIPVDRYDADDAFLMKWGIGTHLGRAVSQNVYGDMLGHVYDHAAGDPSATRTRGYQTNAALAFHVDRADMTSLLCLSQGRSGGLSRIVSSVSVHNAILARNPELLAPLYEGLPYIVVEAAGEIRTWNGPVFGLADGVLSCSFRRNTIQKAIESPEVMLSPLKAEALACMDAVMDDAALAYEMELRPGDIQFVNNYTVMHGRTAFTDGDQAGGKRHLVRLWLKFLTPRPVTDYFQGQYAGVPKSLDHNPTAFRTQ